GVQPSSSRASSKNTQRRYCMPRITKNNCLTKLSLSLALLCIGLCLTASTGSGQTTNPVVQWNRVLLQIVRMPGVQPATVHATRNFAIMHAAIYDAVNAIGSTSRPYAVDLSAGSQSASP